MAGCDHQPSPGFSLWLHRHKAGGPAKPAAPSSSDSLPEDENLQVPKLGASEGVAPAVMGAGPCVGLEAGWGTVVAVWLFGASAVGAWVFIKAQYHYRP